MSKNIHAYSLGAGLIKILENYEINVLESKTTVMSRIFGVLPKSSINTLLGVKASSIDKTVAVIYTVDDDPQTNRSILLKCEDPKSLGSILFRLAACLAPVHQALHAQYSFDYIYALAEILMRDLVPGDKDTYMEPIRKFTSEILQTGDSTFDIYRCTSVCESKTDEFTMVKRAIVHSVAELVQPDTSNNFGEMFPLIIYGKKYILNAAIPGPAKILVPHDDETILGTFKKMDLVFTKSIEIINNVDIAIEASGDISQSKTW